GADSWDPAEQAAFWREQFVRKETVRTWQAACDQRSCGPCANDAGHNSRWHSNPQSCCFLDLNGPAVPDGGNHKPARRGDDQRSSGQIAGDENSGERSPARLGCASSFNGGLTTARRERQRTAKTRGL